MPVVLRTAPTVERLEGWSFVLQALGIAHQLVTDDNGATLVVDEAVAARAAAALDAHDREQAEAAAAREPPAPDQGPTTLGAAISTALVAFFFVTGPRGAAGP